MDETMPFGGDIPRMDGSTLPGLQGDCNATWALYFSYWFTAMEKTYGITYWGFTAQNEPTAINATGVQWDACGYTAEGMAEFIRVFLGPVMQRDHPSIRLMIFDHNNDHVEEWANVMYGDPYVASIAWGTAIHWYSGSVVSLNNSHSAHPTRPILHTEGCNPATGPNNYDNAETYATRMMQFLQAYSTGFNDWNLMLDKAGGPHHANGGLDAPLIYDGAGGFFIQPYYYAFGHFSRFLPEGTVINGAMSFGINATVPAPEGAFWYEFVGLNAATFGSLAGTMPNGTRVVISLNLSGDTVHAALKTRQRVGGPFVYANLTLPPHSMQTRTWDDA